MTLSEAANFLNISVLRLSSDLAQIGISVSDSDENLSNCVLSSINTKLHYSKFLPLSNDDMDWWGQIFDGTKIFIDTCAYLTEDEAFSVFFEKAIPFLKKYNNRIIIPVAVKNEIEKKANQNKMPLRNIARSALKYIESHYEFFKLQGEENETFADNVFLHVFTKFRTREKMVLISRDAHLCQDILSLNNQKSVRSLPIQVLWLKVNGDIRPFTATNKQNNNITNNEPIPIPSIFRYPCIFAGKDQIIDIRDIPKEGDSVLTSKGAICLQQKIGEGGEGCVYRTNTPYIAKIYLRGKLTLHKQKKIELMINNNLHHPGICFPVDFLFNTSRQFIGYLMPEAKGKEIQTCMFKKPVFLSNFPYWKKKDSVQLCITILKKIQFLHSNNIIMGDINPGNILVSSPSEVIFVDTDSYQIEGYPCSVGTTNFTAPEIMGKNFNDFLRTFGNENFAIATLLFMLMLPGKPPYSQQGGGSPEENIKGMDFSYPLGENTNKKTPEGPWRYIWSHLPYSLKYYFYHTFRKGGDYSISDKRINVDGWISTFEEYFKLLTNGTLEQNDSMSLDIFPTRLKKQKGVLYQVCKICHEEKPSESLVDGVCKSCNYEVVDTRFCERCHSQVGIKRWEANKGSVNHFLCHECREFIKQRYTTSVCKSCGQTFEISQGEHEFYIQKFGMDPSRCKNCRGKNKMHGGIPKSSSQNFQQSNLESDTSFFDLFSKFFK